MRARTSLAEPGPNEMMNRMGRAGQDWASASCGSRRTAAVSEANNLCTDTLLHLPRYSLPFKGRAGWGWVGDPYPTPIPSFPLRGKELWLFLRDHFVAQGANAGDLDLAHVAHLHIPRRAVGAHPHDVARIE